MNEGNVMERMEKAEWVLQNSGFRRCDIPACNCNSWHQVGGYAERFREIKEAVEEAGHSTNGKILLDVVKEILDRAARESAPVAQAALPPLVDRAELVGLLEDLASVNLSREAVERQARRMADDLIARGLSVPSAERVTTCKHPHAAVWFYRDDDTYMRCPDCNSRWSVEKASPVPSTQSGSAAE